MVVSLTSVRDTPCFGGLRRTKACHRQALARPSSVRRKGRAGCVGAVSRIAWTNVYRGRGAVVGSIMIFAALDTTYNALNVLTRTKAFT